MTKEQIAIELTKLYLQNNAYNRLEIYDTYQWFLKRLGGE